MANMQQLCKQVSRIINGAGEVNQGICFVTVPRRIPITLRRQPLRSPLVKNFIFSFDTPGKDGKAINEANLPLLQSEINLVLSEGKRLGLKVGAVHNHWIFVKPTIIAVHFQSIESPLSFAKKMNRILSKLRNR